MKPLFCRINHRHLCRVFPVLLCVVMTASQVGAAWQAGTRFSIGEVNGRPCLLDPNGEPFKSVGMVWAYGPEEGPHKRDISPEVIIEQLAELKSLGFNTLNLYGDRFIPEMLAWCDENEMAVYFRTGYYFLPDFPGDLREYPDYMDPAFRDMAKTGFDTFLGQIKDHPSVLAVDMDHRWLFPLDWSGEKRWDMPKLREKARQYFPVWLKDRYETIEALNEAWGTEYSDFLSILDDKELVRDGVFQRLRNHPARVDTVLYTLWTPVDFLSELTAYMREKAPGILITPTTEHPECIPETNPKPSHGIDFMSPVHYNHKHDYERDPVSLCKLIYETRWHYDLQGAPAYISETGWRTDPLKQDPPNRDYAWIQPPTEQNAAQAYASQFALLNVLPWVSGYGWFKLYDKWPEGDFGYLRDDGSRKPIAYVGDAINEAFDAADLPDIEPELWIYYPDHAHATHRPAFQQVKTLVYMLQKDFLDALDQRIAVHWEGLKKGDKDAGKDFAEAVTADFTNLWRGFAFTASIPEDDKPIVLLSTISEILTQEDREALLEKKTISFGQVGVRDRAMRETPPWQLETVGLSKEDVAEHYTLFNPVTGDARELQLPENVDSVAPTNWPWTLVPLGEFSGALKCEGSTINVTQARYKRLELAAGSMKGNAAPYFYVHYADGTKQQCVMGPTISDMRYQPMMTGHLSVDRAYLSLIEVGLEPEKTLVSIEFPDAPWVYVFSGILVNGGEAENVNLTLSVEDVGVTGRTISWVTLNDAGRDRLSDLEVEVIQENVNGDPLVLATDRHAVFLYDPLNWADMPNEMSRYVDVHRATLDAVLQHFAKGDDNE